MGNIFKAARPLRVMPARCGIGQGPLLPGMREGPAACGMHNPQQSDCAGPLRS